MKRFSFTIILTLLCAVAYAAEPWKAGAVIDRTTISRQGVDRYFGCDTISNEVYRRMRNRSLPMNRHVSRHDLRYLRLLHYDFRGRIVCGEMVCNKAIAHDLMEIFRKLFDARYAIERMVLIDDYNANDELSMSHNNTSCFCYRAVSGSQRLSRHSYGMAVDINPLYNPCVKTRKGRRTVQPASASKWADRTGNFKHKIAHGDLCYRLFTEHGFRWGGAWRSVKDYQHFEK